MAVHLALANLVAAEARMVRASDEDNRETEPEEAVG
jgi:hypothetical protein